MTDTVGIAEPSGSLSLKVIRGGRQPVPAGTLTDWPARVLTVAEIDRHGFARKALPDAVNQWRRRNARTLRRGVRRVLLARALRLPHMYGQLFLTVCRADGTIEELGLASMRVVTTVGVKFICDDFNNNTTDVSLMKFHGFGTGATAEAVGNTALVTEVTNTTYVGDVRPTGSQASATVTNDATYTTVGTYSPDSGGPFAITEHGIFSANAVGTLLDRSVFSAVNLTASADSLQATYVLTVVAGS